MALLYFADPVRSCPTHVPVVSPACSVDAVGEMLDAFTADVPLHFGAEGMTQSDGRMFMWDRNQMVVNDSALYPGQLGLTSV